MSFENGKIEQLECFAWTVIKMLKMPVVHVGLGVPFLEKSWKIKQLECFGLGCQIVKKNACSAYWACSALYIKKNKLENKAA